MPDTKGKATGPTPWRADPLIRERIQHVWKAWARGLTEQQIRAEVNAWLAAEGRPAVSAWTIGEDKKRILELLDDSDEDMRRTHLESLRLVKQRAYEELEHTTAPMAVPGLLRTIVSAEETAAKIDGSLITRVESQQTITHEVEAKLLVGVLVKYLGSEEQARLVLDEVARLTEDETKRLATQTAKR